MCQGEQQTIKTKVSLIIEVMAEAVVSVLLDKLLALLLKEGQELIAIDGRFNTLKNELCFMQPYLVEAEKVKSTNGREVLQTTIRELRELVYDVEDVMDDYQLLFLDQGKGFLNLKICCSPQILSSRWKIAKQLKEVSQRISEHNKMMTLYLSLAPTTIIQRVEDKSQTSSYPCLMEKNDIVGLGDDYEKIKKWIFEGEECLTVIGIVGMGGIGKTTLVQKICNDNDVKLYFEPIIFVNVSKNCEYIEVLKRILRNINKEQAFAQHEIIVDLLRNILMGLEGKKYMLVLDDVWRTNGESWWYSLQSALPKRNGCCVITTTRNESVARSMGANNLYICHLEILSSEESWLLFTKIAFARNGGKCWNSNLECIGREIVATCGGLPLAIKAVGGMLLEKGDSIYEWRRILQYLQSAATEVMEDGQEQVLSSLKLSYEELPKYLKPCFLCFSMFPKGSCVNVVDIIYWWIGEGFIYEMKGITALEIGRERMRELINRCLLIGEEKEEFNREFITVRVHDLVLDMIIKIALDQNFITLSERGTPKYNVNSRRIGMLEEGDIENSGILEMKSTNKSKLRTFWGQYMNQMAFSGRKIKFGELTRLRVLYLEVWMYGEDENAILRGWFNEITRLPHLVYLKIVQCELEMLPDSIGNLHYLQILCLHRWCKLKTLPPTICKLQNLTIMEVSGNECWDCIPEGMGRLFKLQRLWLGNPVSALHSSQGIARLRSLKGLRELAMVLGNIDQLDFLSELPYLRQLYVIFYSELDENGPSCGWNSLLSPLLQLEELWLFGFPKETATVWFNPRCLPNLQFLCIHGGSLRSLGPGFYSRGLGEWKIESLAFLFLEELREDWECLKGALPCLKLLKVSLCPNLKSFPLDVNAQDAIWRKGEGCTIIGS